MKRQGQDNQRGKSAGFTASDLKKIFVLMPHGFANTAKIMRGLLRFARPNCRWTFRLAGVVKDTKPIKDWKADGIIAYPTGTQVIEEIKSLGVPTVYVTERVREPGSATVAVDSMVAGKLAARHLIERGFRHFGVLFDSSNIVSDRRQQGFARALKACDFTVEQFDLCGISSPLDRSRGLSGEEIEPALARWLEELPKPVGLLSWHDTMLPIITETCLQAGISIPQDVAVVGVDNDETFCELCYPAASSVAMPFEEVGFRTARVLADMMSGLPVPPEPILIPPVHVLTRQSTEALATTDPVVRKAVEFIRRSVHEPISVREILAHVDVSRRSLENHFTEAIGRTPLQELHRIRVERAQHFLLRSQMDLNEVATSCGFTTVKRMNAAFERWTGMNAARCAAEIRQYL